MTMRLSGWSRIARTAPFALGLNERVDAAVGVQPRDISPLNASDHRELASDDDLSIGLRDHGEHIAIDVRVKTIRGGGRLGKECCGGGGEGRAKGERAMREQPGKQGE